MKQFFLQIALLFASLIAAAQGIHFSQYYNSPSLLNPANTAFMPEDDYRAGVQYRNQYQSIPVPYNTVSAFADFGIGRNKNENSWWGLGVAFWNDAAGAAKLKLNKAQVSAAYHFLPSEKNMVSFGTSVGYVGRKIDLTGLTFDSQWDEFSFNNDLPSNEKVTTGTSTYADVQIGMNWSHFDNEKIFWKVGASVLHLNQPKETFIGTNNRLGMRPVLDAEFTYKGRGNFIITPSVYYTMQKSASELVFGFNTTKGLVESGSYDRSTCNEWMSGFYYRVGDAIIAMTGYRWQNTAFTISYDHTISKLAIANAGVGAFEISLIYSNKYGKTGADRKILGCPRF